MGDNSGKLELIPHVIAGIRAGDESGGSTHRDFGRGGGPRAVGGACVGLACWWGNGLPRRRSIAGLRGRSATLGLRHGPDGYGRQQVGILHNGRKPDAAMPRV